MIPFEGDNLKAYALLLRIEIALRELVKNAFVSEFDKQWQKRLPGDLLRKIRESQTIENRPQFGYARLGPLYYLTFGELLTLLQQKPSRPVVEKLGGECILKQLENIFTPRNAVCHSRPVSPVGLEAIQALYAQIETALTADGFKRLISKPDVGLSPEEVVSGLIPSLKNVLCNLSNLPQSFFIPEIYTTAIVQFWWVDDALAGFNRAVVEAAFACVNDYNVLPVGVGCAGTRQAFIQKQQMKQTVQDAITEMEKIRL